MSQAALLGFILASKYRQAVLLCFRADHLLPSEIVKTTKMRFSHVSRALRELREREVLQIVNPEMRKGRMYALTATGRTLREKLVSRSAELD